MPYSDKEFKNSNINYINKDFSKLKASLVEYAKTYFPNTYRDFNETSPGMMLIEMSAYVGDVLSFYIDQQYREMLLPLAEERRNVINVAKMLGYKVKPTMASKVNVQVTIEVDADTTSNAAYFDNPVPTWTQAFVIRKGMQLGCTTDTSVFFETLEDADFTISRSMDPPYTQSAWNSISGQVSKFRLVRNVIAISGQTKTTTFDVTAPKKFLELTLPETDVIEILSVKDANGNNWYEVQYLAQDKVPIETHYTDGGSGQATGYYDIDSTSTVTVPIPYSLSYIKSPKRFIVDVDEDNKTTLVFGNGTLRTGASEDLEGNYNTTQGVGVILPGSSNDINTVVSDTLGTVYSTLGETPANTVLTVEYRIGGGINSNVPVGTIVEKISATISNGSDNSTIIVNNTTPARGGSSGETVEEIRQRAQAFFSTQDRCVTKEDYEARVMNLPARFGNIAKVYTTRSEFLGAAELFTEFDVDTGITGTITNVGVADSYLNTDEFVAALSAGTIPTIQIYLLSYDNKKSLIETPLMIKNNLKTYLSQYRIITDTIEIKNGFIINFGVVFDVVVHRHANKGEVKLQCIDVIKNYFNIEKMLFKQSLELSQLEYDLMGVDGVRAVNSVTLSQTNVSVSSTTISFPEGSLYDIIGGTTGNGTTGYGYQYNFTSGGALSTDGSLIMPSLDPAVFELKNPDKNIIGVVS